MTGILGLLAFLLVVFAWIMGEHRLNLTLAAVTCIVLAVITGSWGSMPWNGR